MTWRSSLEVHDLATGACQVILRTPMLIEAPIAGPILAQMVVLAWAVNSSTSAWTLPVVVTSSAYGVPIRDMVFGRNVGFAITFGLCACLALAGLNRLLS